MIKTIKANGNYLNQLSNQVSFKNQQINQDYENEIESYTNLLVPRKNTELEKHLQSNDKPISSSGKQSLKTNQKYSIKRISVRHLPTPSINKLQISSKQFTNIVSSNKLNSENSSRSSQNDERKYMRKTCKMFQLDYKIDKPKTTKTMKNLVTNFQNNKFNQVEDNENYYRGKKDKSFKVLRTSSKNIKQGKYEKIKANEKTKTQTSGGDQIKENRHLKVNFSAKCSKRMARKSQFSGKIGKMQLQEMQASPICSKGENKVLQPPKQSKQSKFTEIKKLCAFSNYQSDSKNLPWMKWKKCHKNTQFNKNTQRITTYLVNQNLEQNFKQLYEEQIKQKKQQLRRFNIMRSGVCKLKSNQKLIQSLRYQNKQRIQQFFDDLEEKVLLFSEFANQHQCNASQLEGINQQLRIEVGMMEANAIKN